MTCAIIDYSSGNLHSAEKSFQRMAVETGTGPVVVTADPEVVARAERIVLPGVGAFGDCRAGLAAIDGLFEVIEYRVINQGVPFLGICVGAQMMASWGREHGEDTAGFGWIPGEVVRIKPDDVSLKIPHMGWNALQISREHPLLDGIKSCDHAYFVHSYHMVTEDSADVLAAVDHGGSVTAMVGRSNMAGTQFHPEKSQKTGLRLIANFLTWVP